MQGRDRTHERLIALFVLGVVALLPPVALVFNHPARVLGIPVLYLYIFVVWAGLIGLSALIARGIDDGRAGDRDVTPGGQQERGADA